MVIHPKNVWHHSRTLGPSSVIFPIVFATESVEHHHQPKSFQLPKGPVGHQGQMGIDYSVA